MLRVWCAVVLAFSAAAVPTGQTTAPAPQSVRKWGIPLSACENGSAMCGTYEVFENRAARSGRKIKLNLEVVPAQSSKPEPDAVFPIAGGPGGAATDGFAPRFFNKTRDVVLLDQRGAGKSNPLQCHVDDGVSGQFAHIAPLAQLDACRDRLEKIADLRQYMTSIAMDDLDEVRAALGYDQIDVVGSSYGTTAALDYLRRHGNHVRTVVISGVVPPSYRVPLPFPHTVQESVDAVLARCAADVDCHNAYPNLKTELLAVLGRLDKAPVTVKFSDPPEVPEPVQVTLSRGMFADFFRYILYDRAGISLLPAAIHSAYNGHFEMYAMLGKQFSLTRSEGVSMGMYYSILCNESFPFIGQKETEEISKGTYTGDFRIREQRKYCEGWPDAHVPKSFIEPVRSDKPVLMMSGGLDPAAQPEYATEAAKYLPNSLVVIIPTQSHDAGGTPCEFKIQARFIDAGSAVGLDTSCATGYPMAKFKLGDPTLISVPQATLDEYAGTYQSDYGQTVTVSAKNGMLMANLFGNPDALRLYPESQSKFFFMNFEIEAEFVRAGDGKVVQLDMDNQKYTKK